MSVYLIQPSPVKGIYRYKVSMSLKPDLSRIKPDLSRIKLYILIYYTRKQYI